VDVVVVVRQRQDVVGVAESAGVMRLMI